MYLRSISTGAISWDLITPATLTSPAKKGTATDLINVAEALQEKKIAQIADTIFHRGENGDRVKLILISGPSSSGKTTFSKRLSIQLMTNGSNLPDLLGQLFVDPMKRHFG